MEEEDEDEEEEEGAEAEAEFEAEANAAAVGGAAKSDASPDGALRVTPPTDVQES